MTITEHLRSTIIDDADAWELGGLQPIADITATAQKRRRRNRFGSGMVVGLVAMVAIAAVGLVGNRADDSVSLYATAEGPVESPQPLDIETTDDGFAGLAWQLDEAQETARLVIVESLDGEEWSVVDDNGIDPRFEVVAASYGPYNHQWERRGDDFYVATIVPTEELVGDHAITTRDAAVIGVSSDLRSWDTSVIAIDTGDELRGLVDLLLTGDGDVALSLGPTFNPPTDIGGVPLEDICQMEPHPLPGNTVTRRCGSADYVLVDDVTSFVVDDDSTELFVSRDGLPFAEITLPPGFDEPQFLGLGPATYATDDGFGIAGRVLFETTDAETWTAVSPEFMRSSRVLATGDARLVIADFPGTRSGPDSPIAGTWFTSDGSTWTNVDLSTLFAQSEIPRLWIETGDSNEHGFTLIAHYSLWSEPFDNEIPPSGLDRDPGGQPFAVTNIDGWRFEGHASWGPAALIDPDGRVAATWDHFEAAQLRSSGAIIGHETVGIVDPLTEDVLTRFDQDDWRRAIGSGPDGETHVLWSADGLDWQIVHTTDRWVANAIPADQAVIVSTVSMSPDTVRVDLPD